MPPNFTSNLPKPLASLTILIMLVARKKLPLIFLGLLVLAFAAWKIFFPSSSKYEMGKVSRAALAETVTESGIVATSGRVNVYSLATGMLSQLFVKNGDRIIEGQKLFSVKSTATATEKAIAWAAYQSAISSVQAAQNNRRLTQATVDRVHDDIKDNDKDENFLEKEARTTAEVAHDNAYDALLSAQAALASAQASYLATQNATVFAPIAGVVSNLSVSTGSAVIAGNALSAVQPVLVVSGIGQAEVAIALGESDINKISVGQLAKITFDAIPGQSFAAHVARFDDQGTLSQGVVKFAVYLTVSHPSVAIKPGMTADVDIQTQEIPDALVVPNSAVKPYQKGRAVRVLKDGKLVYRPVEVGLRGKDSTQIISGLSEGQEIIVSLPSETKKRNSLLSL